MLQCVSGHGANKLLRQVHVALQIAKRHLRLNHPKLRRVAGGIGVLSAEGRTKSVNVRQRASEGLSFQLPAQGQVSGFAKKITSSFFVDVSLKRGHTKHFARAFAIAGRNNWRVDVNEIPFLKKTVHRPDRKSACRERV